MKDFEKFSLLKESETTTSDSTVPVLSEKEILRSQILSELERRIRTYEVLRSLNMKFKIEELESFKQYVKDL